MEILTGQSYEMDNLVSRSGKFTVNEFEVIGKEMSTTFKDDSINNGEYVITTTRAIEDENRIMDVESLLPVNERMEVEEPYVFKDKIKIVNALYIKVTDINLLQEAMNKMNKYIMAYKLLPVSSAYLVQTKQGESELPCTEIYIGISPNIL